MVKRSFDLILALVLLLPCALLYLVICIVYLLIERSNPLFRQVRVGKNEKLFALYKIRTMKQGAANVGTHEIDPSVITGIGSFLRKTKLDELPQVLNVILGNMSFVGPRPCLECQTDVLDARRRMGVFAVRPGITGYAQIQGIDMSQPEALAFADAAYIDSTSLMGDLKIIALTALGSGHGDRVRQQLERTFADNSIASPAHAVKQNDNQKMTID